MLTTDISRKINRVTGENDMEIFDSLFLTEIYEEARLITDPFKHPETIVISSTHQQLKKELNDEL